MECRLKYFTGNKKGVVVIKLLQELMLEITGVNEIGYKRIGGGYYAEVYRFDYPNNERKIVKIYKTKGIMQREVTQLGVLSKYSLVPMPGVLFTHTADERFSCDLIVMEFLEGENGGDVFYFNKDKRNRLANQVVDNLLAFHNIHNSKGFGEIDSENYYETFNEYYREKSLEILEMAKQLKLKGEFSDFVFDVMSEATEKFDIIFYLPITEASLIHGDYNMFNVLVDKKQSKVTAVIDPCGSMWADSEYDLYQLNNANGKHLRLLEVYASKKKLSENYKQKMAFYELFTEVEHYFNSGHSVQQKLIKKQALNLKLVL